MIFKVKSIMKKPVITASLEDSVLKASQRMQQYGIGGLPVIENGKPVGIITSRDVRCSHPNRIVEDAMTKELIMINQDASIWEAYEVLEKNKIERLPVLENQQLVGMITKSDLLVELGKNTDPLTGLNTSGFIRFIGETLLFEGKEIIVLLFDLDDFGQFNKKYGHVTGDKCLKIISEVLSRTILPETDYLCRYGGDEFVIITTRMKDEVVNWAKYLLTSIEKEVKNNNLLIQVSVGISANQQKPIPNNEASALLDNLINNASLASSKAKKEGQSLLMVG